MDSIEQLRAMRDAARNRIESLPDYKLMTKLTTLIEELEDIFTGGETPQAKAEEVAEDAEEEVDLGRAPAREPPAAEFEPVATEPVAEAPVAEAPAESAEQPRQGLHKWQSSLAAKTLAEDAPRRRSAKAAVAATAVAETFETFDGQARVEIEETVIVSPVEEFVEEFVEPTVAGETVAEPEFDPVSDLMEEQLEEALQPDYGHVEEEQPIDTSSALEQAMAELEADLGADLGQTEPEDPRVSRFRYGNSS